MSYKLEIIETKNPIKQLEASKSSIKRLFSNLLDGTKGFEHQIKLSYVEKIQTNGEMEFRPVNFNLTTKTVITG